MRLAFWGTRRVMQATMGFSGDMLRPRPICRYLHAHNPWYCLLFLQPQVPPMCNQYCICNKGKESKAHLLQRALPSRRSGVKGEGISGSHAGSHNAVSMPFRTPCTWHHQAPLDESFWTGMQAKAARCTMLPASAQAALRSNVKVDSTPVMGVRCAARLAAGGKLGNPAAVGRASRCGQLASLNHKP